MTEYELREKVMDLLAELMAEEMPTMCSIINTADKIIDAVQGSNHQ